MGENLQDFGDELMSLCKKAYPKMEFEAREEVVLEQFKQMLDITLRRHVQFTHPSSLDEAVLAGLEFEAMEEGTLSKKPANVMRVVTSTEPDNLAKAFEQILKLGEQNAKILEELSAQRVNRRQMRKDVECFGCHEKGHYKRDCQKKTFNKGNLNGE